MVQNRIIALLLCLSLWGSLPCMAVAPTQADTPLPPPGVLALDWIAPYLLSLGPSPTFRTAWKELGEGLPGSRQEHASFEDAFDALSSRFSSSMEIDQQLEGPFCTVFLAGWGGLPHGSTHSLVLLYRENSFLGEGTMIFLPLPQTGAMSGPRAPDSLEMSEDGKFLSYSYQLPPPIYDMDPPGGDFQYTTDLTSGITWLQLSALE